VAERRAAAALWPAALVAAVFVVFSPILGNGFVNWDDPGNILRNPWLGRFDARGLAWTFKTTQYGHFQPLAWLSLSLDKTLWGLEPGGFHATALILHAVSAVLLFLLLRELLSRRASTPGAVDLPAAAGAALFILHPLRVESVAWATERRDGLSLLFLLLSALLYARAVARNEKAPLLGPSLAAFAAAALSKVVVFVFPVLLICLDAGLLDRRRNWGTLFTEKIGFWIVSAAILLLGVRAQVISGSAPSLAAVGVGDRLAAAVWTPGWAAWKTVFPVGLTPFVCMDWRTQPGRFWPPAVLSLVLAAGVTASSRRGLRALAAAWLTALLPALGLFKSGPQSAADRFTLLPGAVLAVGCAVLLRRLGRGASWAALCLAAGLGVLTRAQSFVWRDSISLWTRAAQAEPPAPLVVRGLGSALREAGREKEALALFSRLDSSDSIALVSAADARYRSGDWKESSRLYARALQGEPDLASVRVNLGLSLYRQGLISEAAGHFARACDDDPQLPDAWHNLGVALARLGRSADAELCLRKALELSPGRRDSRDALLKLRSLAHAGEMIK